MKKYKQLYLYKILAAKVHKFIVSRDPESEMRRVYYKTFHRYPDLKNPKNLIEKIYWLQLHSDTSLWTKCADKFAVREYVKECGCEKYLPVFLGKWDKAKDINFRTLPKAFVMKSNNGCGTVLVVRDKSILDENETKQKLQRWLNVPYGWAGGQLHYTRIKPCIIAEELLVSSSEDKIISPNSLIDYKVWCFKGKPESVWVAYNRHDAIFVDMALYDLNWNPIPEFLKNTNTDKYHPEVDIPKPVCLGEMLQIASQLSRPFPEVRVDFYVVDGKPVIGEMTFTSGYGFFTDEYYDYLGSKIDLSNL